ncbi:putative 3-hydroxybutyryl-CoA dehydrogenase [uncultured delta proteobacterium]|uniref:Putative 3-hydroxybutyryl-CoA dehydrogenase n=1 Tax=uncultured delta proteobacterium TaxID=34034 RepID=A0A212KA28_9DELT|nr:putative 3-hydroxybutyryl-CoA dehydrogenase [uncultured delta proteobacterium]
MKKSIGLIGGADAHAVAKIFMDAGWDVLLLSQGLPCLAGATAVSVLTAFAGCGMVLDLSEEDTEENKRGLTAELDGILPDGAVIVPSTVFLNVNSIAAAARKRGRVVPAHVIVDGENIIIELVKTLEADAAVYDGAKEILKGLFPTVVDAPDALGGIYYRMLPLMPNISARLVMGGTKPEDIDLAMQYGTNFSKAPLRMADAFGLDRILRLLEGIYEETKNQAYRPHEFLVGMVAEGKTGVASGEGFYRYGNEKGGNREGGR